MSQLGGGGAGQSDQTGGGDRFEQYIDPVDGVRWLVDAAFVRSSWTCIWGAGCEGILDHPAADAGQGCCSVGAELLDADEARRIGALGLSLDPSRFQFHHEALTDGVFADRDQRATRLVDGACIFLNRPGFAGGSGCALHLGAVDDGERPMDWKPAVCWQLPLKVESVDGDPDTRILRRWHRDDWGDGGDTMAWCCTERPSAESGPVSTSAYVGDRPVAYSLFEEIEALVGPEVAVEIRSRSGSEPS